MFNSYIKTNRCKLCYPTSQGKLLITTLVKKLNWVLHHSRICKLTKSHQNEWKKKKVDDEQWDIQTSQTLSRLLTVIGGAGENIDSKSASCKHQRIANLLRKRIFCDASTLSHLCQITLSMIAQEHYHLELLAMQLKHAAERIATKTIINRKNSFEQNGARLEPTQLSISGISSSLNDIQEVEKPKTSFFSYS